MRIFIYETLLVAKHSCKSMLEKISKDLSKSEKLIRMDVPGQFLSAANNLDYNKTNQLIDVALKEYLGSDSVVMGLSNYLKKFGIYDDIINMYDDDIIKLVIKNRCKIDDTLKTWGI